MDNFRFPATVKKHALSSKKMRVMERAPQTAGRHPMTLLHMPEIKERIAQVGEVFTVTQVTAVEGLTSSCFSSYSFEGIDANTGVTCVSATAPYLAEANYPELARIWKNDSDAIFDSM